MLLHKLVQMKFMTSECPAIPDDAKVRRERVMVDAVPKPNIWDTLSGAQLGVDQCLYPLYPRFPAVIKWRLGFRSYDSILPSIF
jgi:hypothetical protein